MKRTTALADARNLADHGHFDKVKPEDADDLVKYAPVLRGLPGAEAKLSPRLSVGNL
jgi:hypothetical protein